MKHFSLLVTFAMAVLAASCSGTQMAPSATPLAPPVTQIPTQFATPTLIPPSPAARGTPTAIATLSPAANVVVTPTSVSLAAPKLKIDCISILPQNAPRLTSKGVVVLGRSGPADASLDMSTGVLRDFAQPIYRTVNFVSSSDGAKLAYDQLTLDKPGGQIISEALVIAGADGRPEKLIPWQWGLSNIVGWLNNDQLIINIAAKDPDENRSAKPATLVSLDTKTGQQRTLRPNFPNIDLDYPTADWNGWGETVYDPNLQRVIYSANDFSYGRARFVLWNLQTQTTLANLPTRDVYWVQPAWSPDGKLFAVQTNPDKGNDWWSFELYGGGRDATQFQQWTHLTEYYSKVMIQSFTWSPDSRHIAFWFVPNPQGELTIEQGQMQLGILDVTTGEVAITCIPGDDAFSSSSPDLAPPLWSPDSQQLLVEDRFTNNAGQILLVDLSQHIAEKVADNMGPAVWLTGSSSK
ncbi:MAG TPA: hypothetical protein VKQ72_22525 [Aggregatilineales bacterium]|nr:hypothetical protein [Aggregatilineales bacterium]